MMKLEYMYVFQRRDSMKSFIKIALAAGAIALSCTCTALAAPTADSLA